MTARAQIHVRLGRGVNDRNSFGTKAMRVTSWCRSWLEYPTSNPQAFLKRRSTRYIEGTCLPVSMDDSVKASLLTVIGAKIFFARTGECITYMRTSRIVGLASTCPLARRVIDGTALCSVGPAGTQWRNSRSLGALFGFSGRFAVPTGCM